MKKTHINFLLTRCGLFINKEFPFLHATPDFLTSCDCCGLGCGEVKCPISIQEGDFEKYATEKSSCLERLMVASWLARSTPERAVRVRVLAGDSVLCSWARHFTLTVPLSTQVYKWVPAICWGNLTKLRGSDLRWTSILSRGSRNTSSRLMLQKPG